MSDPNQPRHPENDPPGREPGGQPAQPHPPEQGQQPMPGWRGAPPAGVAPTPSEITWGCAAHWSALVASVIALAFLGPLIVMLTKGNESGYVRAQAVESLNFQLSMLIYGVVAFILVFVLVGFLLLPLVGIAWLVLTIIGAVRSSKGELYRYPLTIRMVS